MAFPYLERGLKIFIACALLFTVELALAAPFEWREGDKVPVTGLSNPYQLPESELAAAVRKGRIHTLQWPVQVTGALIPLEPTKMLMASLQAELGLQKYPATEIAGIGPYAIPYPFGKKPNYRMGFSKLEHQGRVGVTFACAACHIGTLFGRPIFGLTNRFPGANEVFHRGVNWSGKISPEAFQSLFGGTEVDKEMYARTRDNLKSVEARVPIARGLDTSLAHVALSLSHRAQDLDATKDENLAHNPRAEELRHRPADSKPGNWWAVKYKNRYLADGSVVSGNPIFTNLLWNELGRGTDLQELRLWLAENADVIQELTTAIFNSEPPHITDFFPAEKISLTKAQAGEVIFNNRCAKCHGNYIKNWSLPDSATWPLAKNLRTARVEYFEETPIKDVGTDPLRWQGMASLVQLNNLRISRENGIMIRPQQGYVPSPLVGIWARFPYFHNNSIPNLCELLLPAEKRIKIYHAGDVIHKETDYDFECGGYPTRLNTPVSWLKAESRYDTRREGQSNLGHDKNFEQFTKEDRKNLIQFLLTL